MMLFILTTFLAVLALVPGGQVNAIVVRNRNPADNCLANCRSNFGWPGHQFPNDPWGLVMDPKLMSSSSSTSSSSSAAAIPTSLLSPVGAAGVESAPSSHSPILATFTPNLTTPSPSPSLAPNTSSSASSSSTTTHSSANEGAVFNVALPTTKPTSSSPPPPPPPKTSATPPPPPSPSPSPSSAPASSSNSNEGSGSTSGPTSQSDIQAYLAGHNNVRAQHGATALTYSQDLAAKAQQWANGCVFKHSGGTLGPFGENLAAGTGDSYGIPQALQSWTDEVSQYNSANPVPSHFTQVVWKATTQVGCALQDCDGIFPGTPGKAHYYVCEYSPQGNVIGQFGANVQA